MKLVVLDGFLVNHDNLPWELADMFDVTWYDATKPEDTISRIGDAQAVFVNRHAITKEVFNACPNIEYIGVLGTGFNMIDLEAAKEAGVTICNVPAYSTNAVAQCVFSLLLNISFMTYKHNEFVKAGKWNKVPDEELVDKPMFELAGKTMGVIGFGHIGQAVAKIANAMGMEVLAYRRHPDKSLETSQLHFACLDELLAKSDIISLHCPLNPETTQLINKDTIAKMKDGAVLINTSRGGVINDQDVADALDSGKLYMAGLDVLTVEPPTDGNPLTLHPRTILTPHMGWGPKETRIRLLDVVSKNFLAYLNGNPVNVVGE